MYQQAVKFFRLFLSDANIFKYGFNFSPMYRRSTGKVVFVSKDLLQIDVKIPLNLKNKNYVGAIFGGSLYAATDPVFMIQLIHILGDDYVVWDKASTVKYKKPAYADAFVRFQFSEEEIEQIKEKVDLNKEIEIVKDLQIVDNNNVVFTEISKTIYIADKQFYKEKQAKKLR